MRTGTAHFVSMAAAVAYYKLQGFTRSDVQRKLDEKEIFIGPPTRQKGQKISVIAGEGRYQIEE